MAFVAISRGRRQQQLAKTTETFTKRTESIQDELAKTTETFTMRTESIQADLKKILAALGK